MRILSIVILITVFIPIKSVFGATLYSLRDLGAISGTIVPESGYALNDSGVVVGVGLDNFVGHTGFIARPGSAAVRIDGQFYPGGGKVATSALSINRFDHVVGDSLRNTPYYEDNINPPIDIGDFAGGATSSRAFAINNSDVVVGYGTTATNTRAFKWSPGGSLQDLGALPNSNGYSSAHDINDAGWIVGSSNVPSLETPGYAGRAVVWKPDGTKLNLGLLPGENAPSSPNSPASSSVVAINANNVAVGSNSSNHGVIPFTWTEAGGLHPIEALPDGGISLYSNPGDINIFGEIVGLAHSGITGVDIPLYWSADGHINLLSNLVDSSAAGWTLRQANAINDAGQIVGFGITPGGVGHAFLLTPVPEPSGMILAGLAFAGLLFAKRRYNA